MSRGNQQDFDELYVVARPPAITRNEIRKAVSEHRGKRFVYDKMEDVREYWIQRVKVCNIKLNKNHLLIWQFK